MAAVTERRLRAPSWIRDMWADIDHFWFGTTSATTMGVFRILLGFWNLANLILIFPSIDAWFSQRGFTPVEVTERAAPPLARDFLLFNHRFELPFSMPRLDVVAWVTHPSAFMAFYIVLMICALLTTLGLWTRVSSILLAIGVVSLQHRNILILYGGDTVMRLGAIYMAIAPCGKACSLDRLIGLWRGRIKPGPALVSVWPQRLMAYNLALIYFTTWWVKLDGDTWRSGLAVWYPERLTEFYKFPVPAFVKSAWMSPPLTFAALAVELALGTIVFWRPARKWVLILGLMLHGYIEYSMNVPLFAFSITSFYIAFYDGDEVSAWARRLGQRLRRFAVTVRVPSTAALASGPAEAIKAVDALGLVTYEQAEPEELAVDGRPDPTRVIWTHSPGAWILGLVPGLWRKLVDAAIPPGARIA